MPARQIEVDGKRWQVLSSGFITQYMADEFGLVFVSGSSDEREVRFTRYSPRTTRSREQSLAELDDAELIRLFKQSQPSARAPEAGYRA